MKAAEARSFSGATVRVLALCALVLPLALPAAAQSVTERIIEDEISFGTPLDPCVLPAIVWRVVHSVRVPAGLEPVPGPCRWGGRAPRAPVEQSRLTGLTVHEALDRLVRLDPRYWWTVSNGVILVRPLQTWNDRDHFLHRTVSQFVVNDQHLGGALDEINNALGPLESTRGGEYALSTPDANKRFTVRLGATSIVEALTAVVRAHGALLWHVTYCRPEARHENATIWLTTYDGGGLGRHAAVLADGGGRRYSPCQSAAAPF